MSKLEKIGSTVIIGSFRFKDQIEATREYFENFGIEVLSPPVIKGVKVVNGFKVINGESPETGIESESVFLNNMNHADFLYVINGDGYIGLSGAIELSYNYFALKKCVFGFSSISTNPFERLTFSENLLSGYEKEFDVVTASWPNIRNLNLVVSPDILVRFMILYGIPSNIRTNFLDKNSVNFSMDPNPTKWAEFILAAEAAREITAKSSMS